MEIGDIVVVNKYTYGIVVLTIYEKDQIVILSEDNTISACIIEECDIKKIGHTDFILSALHDLEDAIYQLR